MSDLIELRARLKDLIINTCNKIGCDDCGLSYGDYPNKRCSATDLQDRIDTAKTTKEKNEH